MALTTFIVLCSHHPRPPLELFHPPVLELCPQVTATPQLLTAIPLLSASTHFTTPDTSFNMYVYYHIILALWGLAYFTQHVLKVDPRRSVLSACPSLSGWIMLYCMDMPRFVYAVIHSQTSVLFPFSGYCECALLVIGLQIWWSPCFQFFSSIYPEVRLLHHMVVIPCLMFWGPAILFSIGAAAFCISSDTAQGSNFCTSSPTLVIFCFLFVLCFDNSHPNGCARVSHCSFDLYFLMIIDVEHLFLCALALGISSLKKHQFKFFVRFSIRLFALMLLSCRFCFFYPGFWPLIRCVICKYTPSLCGLPFTLLITPFDNRSFKFL